MNFVRNGLRFDAEGFAGPWSRGGRLCSEQRGCFWPAGLPPDSQDDETPRTSFRMRCTGLGGVRVEPSGRGEALLRTKMAILGHVVLSRAPQGMATGSRTPELYLEWDSDGR